MIEGVLGVQTSIGNTLWGIRVHVTKTAISTNYTKLKIQTCYTTNQYQKYVPVWQSTSKHQPIRVEKCQHRSWQRKPQSGKKKDRNTTWQVWQITTR